MMRDKSFPCASLDDVRTLLRDDPDLKDTHQVRYRHIREDYVVEPRDDDDGDRDGGG